jgi:hypothetical protein
MTSYFDAVRHSVYSAKTIASVKLMWPLLSDRQFSCAECGAMLDDEDFCYELRKDIHTAHGHYDRYDVFCAPCIEDQTPLEVEKDLGRAQ